MRLPGFLGLLLGCFALPDDQCIHHGNCSSPAPRELLASPASPAPRSAPKGAKNVLFLVADDMRPSLGLYGMKEGSSPNLDRLAAEGVTFSRAYVQFSYCAPSRNSFMSGRRPDANKVYSFVGHFRQTGPNWTSLPEHFRRNGYSTTGTGKLFHEGLPPNYDQPRSWSPELGPYYEVGGNDTNLCKEHCCGSLDPGHVCPTELAEGTYLGDQRDVLEARSRLAKLAAQFREQGQPFFLGVGFLKPHLSWTFPREFWDVIPENVSVAKHRAYPRSVHPIGWHECAECSSYPRAFGAGRIAFYDDAGHGREPPPEEWDRYMRRGYYAAIAYVDALIGNLLDDLDRHGVANDTVVSFIGDHGWNLGEHDIWCKMTNFETGTRVPLIFRAPWKAASRGKVTTAFAEAVDLFPTLAELAGVPVPAAGEDGSYEYLGGTSLAPIFDDVEASVKDVALSQFPRCWNNNTGFVPNQYHGPGDELNKTVSFESMSDCHWVRRGDIDFMGYSMRVENWRYVEWVKWHGATLMPLWDHLVARELYDHSQADPRTAAYIDETENENLAEQPDMAEVVKSLSRRLHSEVARWIVPATALRLDIGEARAVMV